MLTTLTRMLSPRSKRHDRAAAHKAQAMLDYVANDYMVTARAHRSRELAAVGLL